MKLVSTIQSLFHFYLFHDGGPNVIGPSIIKQLIYLLKNPS